MRSPCILERDAPLIVLHLLLFGGGKKFSNGIGLTLSRYYWQRSRENGMPFFHATHDAIFLCCSEEPRNQFVCDVTKNVREDLYIFLSEAAMPLRKFLARWLCEMIGGWLPAQRLTEEMPKNGGWSRSRSRNK